MNDSQKGSSVKFDLITGSYLVYLKYRVNFPYIFKEKCALLRNYFSYKNCFQKRLNMNEKVQFQHFATSFLLFVRFRITFISLSLSLSLYLSIYLSLILSQYISISLAIFISHSLSLSFLF